MTNTFREHLQRVIFKIYHIWEIHWIDWFEFSFMMRTHQKYPAGCHGGVLTDRNLSFPPLNNKDTQTWSHASLQSCKNWISFSPQAAASHKCLKFEFSNQQNVIGSFPADNISRELTRLGWHGWYFSLSFISVMGPNFAIHMTQDWSDCSRLVLGMGCRTICSQNTGIA